MLKYRPSSLGKVGPPKKQPLPEISMTDLLSLGDEKFTTVPYIDYEKHLRKPRDWTIVLG